MCSRTARVMTTLMRNGRDRRSGKPVKGHAKLERALLVGIRSADHIRASGHNGCIATGQASTRKQAGYMAAPERFAKRQHFHGRRSLRVRSGHGRTRCRLDPVARDPDLTLVTANLVRCESNNTVDHSTTSSAVASSVGGLLRPIALAVLRLKTNWYFVGACTAGRPASRPRDMPRPRTIFLSGASSRHRNQLEPTYPLRAADKHPFNVSSCRRTRH